MTVSSFGFFWDSRIRVNPLYFLFSILDHFCLKDPIRKLLKEKNNWINRAESPRKSENFCSSKSQIMVSESFLPNVTKEEVKKLLHFDEIKGNIRLSRCHFVTVSPIFFG